MPLQHKSPETIYRGQEAYVRIDAQAFQEHGEVKITSEPIIADEVVKKVNRNGFEITYLTYLVDLFDKLGGKKYTVFKYILAHKSAENTLIITTRELARKTETSVQTVTDTLKLLEESGLIARKTGAIMLLPKVAHRGNDRREAYLMQKFVEFDDGEQTED
mgnify:FL=1|jgi:hypothetical protein